MLIRDGLPSLTTCLVCLVAFVLFTTGNVIYNRLGPARTQLLIGKSITGIRANGRLLSAVGTCGLLFGMLIVFLHVPSSF